MNSFCRCLRQALIEKFNIDVDIYVSKKKKKLVYLSLMKPLMSYENVKAINNFIRTYWNQQKYFFLTTFIFAQN